MSVMATSGANRAAIALAALIACAPPEEPPVPAPTDWLEWRRDLDERTKTSPTSYISAQDAAFVVAGFVIYLDESLPPDDIHWQRTADDGLSTIRYDAEGALYLRDGVGDPIDLLTHGPLELANGLTVAAGVQKDDSLRVTLFNPQHPALLAFDGFRFFPYDPRAVVTGRFTPLDDRRRQTFTTTQKRTGYVHLLGEIEVDFGGEVMSLEAISFDREKDPETGPTYLAVMFKDRSSGRETYGGGRYLTVELPDGLPAAGTEIELDFNRTTNFYCARSPHWNCPILTGPRLPVAIQAGEMVPAADAH